MNDCDVLIVGAGPAGSAAAATLAAAGRRVLVFEKDHFPRAKVCGEFLSGRARADLRRLGVLDDVEAGAERIERGFLHLPRGRSVAFELPSTGLGISRARLDTLLARRAAELGAEVRYAVRVTSIERDAGSGFLVRFVSDASEHTLDARSVIGAWGRWDALDRRLRRRFLAGGRRFFGWSRDYAGGGRLAGQVHLFLFPGGYCGLSRVEEGATNLAGVISERMRRNLDGGWDAVVDHVRRSSAAFDAAMEDLRPGPGRFLGIGPVFFTAKPPVENRIFMVGDAAGVIDPFSGEGQAGALRSGILAAEILGRGLDGQTSMEDAARIYARDWRERFFRGLALRPAAAAVAERLAGPSLLRFAIARLGAQ
jgi:flavin-dependent dehydrogenase